MSDHTSYTPNTMHQAGQVQKNAPTLDKVEEHPLVKFRKLHNCAKCRCVHMNRKSGLGISPLQQFLRTPHAMLTRWSSLHDKRGCRAFAILGMQGWRLFTVLSGWEIIQTQGTQLQRVTDFQRESGVGSLQRNYPKVCNKCCH